MRSLMTLCAGLALLGLSAALARADAPTTPQADATCLSFDNALRQSATISAEIGQSVARRDEAAAQLRAATARRWPQISAYGRGATSGGSGLLDGRTDNQLGLQAQQRIFDFGQTKLESDAARARLSAADYAAGQSEDDHYLETAMHYIAVLEGEERKAAAHQRAANYRTLLQSLPRQLEVSLITRAEANSMRAQAAKAEADLIAEDLALQTAMAELFIRTGTNDKLCRELPPRLINTPQMVAMHDSDWIDHLVQNHKLVKASSADIDAARAEYHRVQRSKLPTLSASGVVAYVYDDVLNTWEQEERLGLNVSTPLWNGGQNRANADAALARRRIAEQELARARRHLLADIMTTLRQVLAGDALIQSRRDATLNLSKEVDAVRREFENGLRPYQDVEITEAELQSAHLEEIHAKYQLRQQQVRLLYLQQKIAPMAE